MHRPVTCDPRDAAAMSEVPDSPPVRPPAAEGAFQHLVRWISDRANPMLVRCIRQELRSKAFIGMFILLLVVSTIAAIASAGASTGEVNSQLGRTLFSVLGWAWSLVVVVQAISTFQSVIRERNDDTWDLLDLTGLGPRKVLRGLLLANMVQAQLYTAALAPFLVMAYLLRGIDLLTIGFALVVVPLAGVAGSTLAVFLASIGSSKAGRAFFGGILGLGLMGLWMSSAAAWFELRGVEWFLNRLVANSNEAWLALGICLNLWLAFVVAMLVLSGALMTHRAGDRSSGPRLLWYGIWLNALGWFLVMAWNLGNAYSNKLWLGEACGAFAITGVAWAALLGLFSLSEDATLTPRQARNILQAPAWRRWATVIHGPGASRGRLAFLLLALMSVGIGACGLVVHDDPGIRDWFIAAWVLWCYLAAIFLVGDWCYRGWAAPWLDSTMLRRAFLLVLLIAVSVGPILVGLVVDARGFERSSIALVSPIMGLIALFSRDHGDARIFTLVISLIGVTAIILLLLQGLRLGITTRRIAARDDDRNPRAQ
jgi:hypothetical protein